MQLPKAFAFGNCQLVAAVVLGVGGMALNPMVVDFVLLGQAQQHFPEVGIQSGLFVGLDPILLFPAPGPTLFQGVIVMRIEEGNQVVSLERVENMEETEETAE